MSRSERQQEILQLFSHIGYESKGVIEKKRNDKLRGLGRLQKRAPFSTFNITHMEEAREFCMVLMGATDFPEFMEVASDAREMLNGSLFVYGVSCAMLNSPVCQELMPPPLHEINPNYFIPSETIARAVKEYFDRENDDPILVIADETGTLEDEENRLTYFREDIGINTHHYHWHLVYPFNGESRDRKGEFFYYMHQQITARYDCERLSVGLKLVQAWRNFDEPLLGYASHLFDFSTGKGLASRPDGMQVIERNHLNRWRERIMDGIHQGYLVDQQGNHLPLTIETGIDVLGAAVEPSNESVNRNFYGSLHNMLHLAIANIHDPRGKFQQLGGAIGNNQTAMRDPAFFRLHKFVDDLFNAYKETLPPYTEEELSFPGIEIKNVRIDGAESITPNVIYTYMTKATLELNHSIKMKSSVKVEYKHMDHEPFSYKINAVNARRSKKEATVRIFLAPVKDDIGQDFPLDFQRRFFIELDKFHVTLKPGENAILRNSTESSVTVRSVPSFDELANPTDETQTANQQSTDNRDFYCSCGWPQHMLLPRGTQAGMEFKLFVMFTDNAEDLVVRTKGSSQCQTGAISYCGLRDKKYPDKKAMGFPFDRRIPGTPQQFIKPNMRFADMKIQFRGDRSSRKR